MHPTRERSAEVSLATTVQVWFFLCSNLPVTPSMCSPITFGTLYSVSESISKELSLRHGSTTKSSSLCVTLPLPHHRPHIHMCTHKYMHIHIHKTNIYMHVHSHRHTCTMHAHTHILGHTAYMCNYVHAHTHAHTYTHTHTNLAVQENVFWFQVPADIERKGCCDVEATPPLLLRQRTKFTGISLGSRDPHTPLAVGVEEPGLALRHRQASPVDDVEGVQVANGAGHLGGVEPGPGL